MSAEWRVNRGSSHPGRRGLVFFSWKGKIFIIIIETSEPYDEPCCCKTQVTWRWWLLIDSSLKRAPFPLMCGLPHFSERDQRWQFLTHPALITYQLWRKVYSILSQVKQNVWCKLEAILSGYLSRSRGWQIYLTQSLFYGSSCYPVIRDGSSQNSSVCAGCCQPLIVHVT